MSHATDPHAAAPHAPSGFGRGWIPASRDIGLPGESLRNAAFPPNWAQGARVPLPQAGGVRGGHSPIGEHGVSHEEEGGAHPQPLPLAGGGIEGLAHPNQFTPIRIARFLEQLSRSGQVRQAARAAGVSQQTAYVRRRRDPAFAAAWDAALVHAREAAEQVLAERALHGTTETIWFRGEAVGERRRFDARLLLAHLARLDARLARTPRAVHALAEDFDHMLLALAEGEDPAAATGIADPARERFLKLCEKDAEREFARDWPEPYDEPDEAWDDWQAAQKAHHEESHATAQAAWATAQTRRESKLAAVFPCEDAEADAAAPTPTVTPAQAGAHAASVVSATAEMAPGLRRDDGKEALAEAEGSLSGQCKPRKPLGVLKCGTAAPALLAASFSWPYRAPRPLPATPVPPLPAPWRACPGVAIGRSW